MFIPELPNIPTIAGRNTLRICEAQTYAVTFASGPRGQSAGLLQGGVMILQLHVRAMIAVVTILAGLFLTGRGDYPLQKKKKLTKQGRLFRHGRQGGGEGGEHPGRAPGTT